MKTITKTRAIIITVYFIIIRSAIVENDSSIKRNKISSLKIVIFVIKKLTSR